MNELTLLTSFELASAATFVICVFLKIIYFIRAGRTSSLKFAGSFFRRYNIYQMMNASAITKDYMKMNNKLNIITWLSGIISIAIYVLMNRIDG